jgi:branched-subunit amino acid aminotransferase/4-amino-4-deoxychorismate lyase
MNDSTDMLQPRVYLNDGFVTASEARISSFDAGFLFGAGVFETIRGSHGEPAWYERHHARLQHSCTALGIGFERTEAELFDIVCELLILNQLSDMEARIKVLVTPGDSNIHSRHRQGTLFVTAIPYIRPSPRIPWKLLLRNDVFATPISTHKCTSYLGYRMLLRQAHDKGYDDVILLDRHGHVSETAVASLLLFREGGLTLPASEDALPGIARSVVADIAGARGIEVLEAAVPPRELFDRTAICVCNALMGPFPVSHINDLELPLPDDGLLQPIRERWMQGRLH